MEIERKWLLRRVPTVKPDLERWMEQFYISFDPEIRLCRVKPKDITEDCPPSYFMTLKGNGDLSRTEVEAAVSEEFYLTALDLVNCQPLQKDYLVYDVDGHKVEVNVVLGKESFVYAEVEFRTEEEAKNYNFPWPELVEREVTYDPNYKMKVRWRELQTKLVELD